MNDLLTPDDQPTYWAGCEEKDFDQLSEFIVDSLREPSGFGTEFPHSEEEFLSLWEMLREKYDAQVKPPEPDKLSSKRTR